LRPLPTAGGVPRESRPQLTEPVSIPLNEVLSYNSYKNGIEVYQEGREKGYFFSVKENGAVELFSLCLGFLLGGAAE
jgi:hypothetical protein